MAEKSLSRSPEVSQTKTIETLMNTSTIICSLAVAAPSPSRGGKRAFFTKQICVKTTSSIRCGNGKFINSRTDATHITHNPIYFFPVFPPKSEAEAMGHSQRSYHFSSPPRSGVHVSFARREPPAFPIRDVNRTNLFEFDYILFLFASVCSRCVVYSTISASTLSL